MALNTHAAGVTVLVWEDHSIAQLHKQNFVYGTLQNLFRHLSPAFRCLASADSAGQEAGMMTFPVLNKLCLHAVPSLQSTTADVVVDAAPTQVVSVITCPDPAASACRIDHRTPDRAAVTEPVVLVDTVAPMRLLAPFPTQAAATSSSQPRIVDQ
ncbi:HSF-type DNA-binding domain-containing protein [Plasmodiophora brassicae]